MNKRPPTSEQNFKLNIDDVLVPTFRVARHSLKEEKNGCEEIKTTEVSDWFLGYFFVLTISSIENLLFISATRKHQSQTNRENVIG